MFIWALRRCLCIILTAGGGLISSSDTIGVHVVTPFKLSGRSEEVLVNRGWISMKLKQTGEIRRQYGGGYIIIMSIIVMSHR